MKRVLTKVVRSIKNKQQVQRNKEIISTFDVTYHNGSIFIIAGSVPVVKLDSETKVSAVIDQIRLMQEAARSYRK